MLSKNIFIIIILVGCKMSLTQFARRTFVLLSDAAYIKYKLE